ncbi:MAG: type II toxin-antitoxin system PemK/MazF family toxin [Candidatus Paceibacterota bacterium]
MKKDFDAWNSKKQSINSRTDAPFYHEREIWWCALGLNIGFEQDGKGDNYRRPVLIIRGFNRETCFAIALTGRSRTGRFYIPLGEVDGREASAVLSQIRIIDTKRLVRKISTLNDKTFESVCTALQEVLFGSIK